MQRLIVNIDEIACQLERDDLFASRVCFDIEKGEIVVIYADVMQAVADSELEMIANFSDWKKDLVETAENILFYEKERYLDLPERLLYKIPHLIEAYLNSLENDKLAERLHEAVEGAGATGRVEPFEKVLFEYPDEKKRWLDFRDGSLLRELAEWLAPVGIEPVANTHMSPFPSTNTMPGDISR